MSTCCLTTLLDASLGNTWVPLILKATQPFKSPKATRHSSCSQANAPALSNTSHMLVLDTGRAGLWRRLKVGLQRRPAAWGVVQVDFFFTSSISSDHSDMKLEINHEKNRKRMNTWIFLSFLPCHFCLFYQQCCRHEHLLDSWVCSLFPPDALPAHLVTYHSKFGTSELREIKSSL